MKDAAGIDRQLRALKPFNRKCKLEISGGVNRPPMERSAGVATLYKKAAEIAKELGWKLEEAAVGGGSDGNFTASLGIPTLDGLGGVGEGAHATHESIIISELPRRAALLAELIERAVCGASVSPAAEFGFTRALCGGVVTNMDRISRRKGLPWSR